VIKPQKELSPVSLGGLFIGNLCGVTACIHTWTNNATIITWCNHTNRPRFTRKSGDYLPTNLQL